MMRLQYESLGWNEQNVLTLPSFRRYLCVSLLRFLSKFLFIIIPSVFMAAIAPGVTEQLNCFGSYVIYGVATFLSLASSIILMIIDFIIPCITNKKINYLTNLFSILICSMMIVYFAIITALPVSISKGYPCEYYNMTLGLYYYTQFPDGFYANTIICLIGWVLSGIASTIGLAVSCKTM